MIAFFLMDLDGGGAERAIVNLASYVADLGHDVTLVVGDANSDYRTEVSDRVRIIDFQTRSAITTSKRLIAFLHKHQPNAVMSALDPANIILVATARLSSYKGKVVVGQRAVVDASLRDLGLIHRLVIKLLLRICMPRADAVISNSHAAVKELNSRLKVPSDKVFTIQNAIDGERIRRLSTKPAWERTNMPQGMAPLIISIGSLTPRKDMATLVRAFAVVRAVRPAKLAIIGKGPEHARLQRLIEEHDLGNDVILPGFDRNPYRWLSAASVFVSASKEEGFPNVIAEALALGCQIVATDCPGDTANLLEQGKWGRLTAIGNPHEMATAIIAAMDAPLPSDGKQRAAQFSPEVITQAYLSVLLSEQSGDDNLSRSQA